jgi:hypothetical protein
LIKVLVEVPFERARQKAGDSEYENVIDYAALELAETVARTLAFRKIEERLTAEGEPAKNLQIPAGRIQKEKISKPALDVLPSLEDIRDNCRACVLELKL